MAWSEIHAVVAKLSVARDRLAARPHLRDLRRRLEATGIDAELEARVRDAVAPFELPTPPMRRFAPGPGESPVLLFAPAFAQVGRLVIERSRDANDDERQLGAVALSQLHRSFRALAGLLAESACGVPAALGHGHQVAIDRSHATIPVDGDSLGVSACVAYVSRWLDEAPRADVVAAAAVREDGALMPVGHLDEKVATLRRALPDVTTIVVAASQASFAAADLNVVRTDHLRDALSVFGLYPDPARLPRMSPRDARGYVRGLEERHSDQYDARQWRRFAREAFLLMHAVDDLPHRALAAAYAAQFSDHAGDLETALAHLRQIAPETFVELPAGVQAHLQIVEATCMIDTEPSAAIPIAERALALAQALPRTERNDWQGRAQGTLGRAFLHAGDAPSALEHLEAAVDHHLKHGPEEAPRSICYLASAERHADNPQGALELCGRARALMMSHLTDGRTQTTSPFLALEEARCLRALDRPHEALERLEILFRTTSHDGSYPRLAGLRESALLYRGVGRHDHADDFLRRCVAVAEDAAVGPMLRAVNAYAFGDALLALERGVPVGFDATRLETLWSSALGLGAEPGVVRRSLEQTVY